MTWVKETTKLTREFSFNDFKTALGFINQVGAIAESNQHHPDILLFNYNHVRITLTTHDEGNQLTAKDYKLAEEIDKIQKTF